MKMSKFTLISGLMSVVFLLILLVTSYGCVESSETFWFRDPNGYFHTNDIERAQNEVPFNIILPSYLPVAIDPDLFVIIGLYEDDILGGEEIEIEYINTDKGIYIFISEKNIIFDWTPTTELEPIYLDIAGTRVLQERTQMLSGSSTKEGIMFAWHQDGLTITLDVFSLSSEEGMEIVESMIKQSVNYSSDNNGAVKNPKPSIGQKLDDAGRSGGKR